MRRYLEAIFGNRDNCLSLGKSIEKNALPHAILIEGDEGSGKRTLAREIAKASLCEMRHDGNAPLPCRACRACHLVENGLAPDVHDIRREDKATLGVDSVREMIGDTAMASTEFDTRFYIFEDADTMTAQAQNALLKILEEPPEGVKILLLTKSADAMLSTVRSRARLVRMQRFTAEEISSYLTEREPALRRSFSSDEALFELLLSAGGSIGRAVKLLSPQSQSALKKEREETLSVLKALAERSYSPLFSAISALPQKREELSRALDRLHTALCDLVLLKRAEAPPLAFFPKADAIPDELLAFRIDTLFLFTDAVERGIAELERNANVTTTKTALAYAMYRKRDRLT